MRGLKPPHLGIKTTKEIISLSPPLSHCFSHSFCPFYSFSPRSRAQVEYQSFCLWLHFSFKTVGLGQVSPLSPALNANAVSDGKQCRAFYSWAKSTLFGVFNVRLIALICTVIRAPPARMCSCRRTAFKLKEIDSCLWWRMETVWNCRLRSHIQKCYSTVI